jgi:uncharacterized protein with HEPN domain
MNDKKRIQDILDAIEAIESYRVANFEEFLADQKTQDAVFYNLIIIGEAANQVTESFQEKYPHIPWSAMIGTRNVIVHGYYQVKLQIVWDILQRDLNGLKVDIVKLLSKI